MPRGLIRPNRSLVYPLLGPSAAVPVVYPKDATSANIVAPTVQWTNGAFTQIVASLPNNFVLVGVSGHCLTSIGLTSSVQFAEGGAGSEVIFDQATYQVFATDPTADASIMMPFNRLFLPRYIASGTRLSACQAQDLAAAWKTTRVYLYGFDVPSPSVGVRLVDALLFGQGHHTLGGAKLPAGAPVTIAHSGVAWTFGAWSQIAASMAEDAVIHSVTIIPNTTGREHAIELGIGGAGSEVALPGYMPLTNQGSVSNRNVVQVPFPLFVPKGTRLAARQKGTSTSGTCDVSVQVSYLK